MAEGLTPAKAKLQAILFAKLEEFLCEPASKTWKPLSIVLTLLRESR